jgi:hypothetical protein
MNPNPNPNDDHPVAAIAPQIAGFKFNPSYSKPFATSHVGAQPAAPHVRKIVAS